MSWLKEGFGCSDEELFEKIEFLTHKVLGIKHTSDAPPSIDTYYLFRRRLCEYYDRTQEDLQQKCFEQVTGSLVKLLKISGKSIRMDSTLIGSNNRPSVTLRADPHNSGEIPQEQRHEQPLR